MTQAGSILAALQTNWSLTGNAGTANVAFIEREWFDAKYASRPQITVSHLFDPPTRYFKCDGGTLLMHTNPHYAANVWVPVPVGAVGTAETQLIDDMRLEIARIILSQKNAIGDFSLIVPRDSGVPMHELDKQPRMLRYEVTLIGAIDKIRG